jgi:hypothetical protein
LQVRSPSVNHEPRQAPWRHKHDIKAQIQGRKIGPPGNDPPGGTEQSLFLSLANGFGRTDKVGTRLHFDDGKNLPTPRQKVDLANRGPQAARKHPIAAKPKGRSTKRFGPPATAPGLLPLLATHPWPS